jgi:hypothetical protein
VIEPLRVEFDVECSPAHAFAVWTEQIDLWWPRSYTVSGDPTLVVLEPRVGGRLFERTADGAEIDWGETPSPDEQIARTMRSCSALNEPRAATASSIAAGVAMAIPRPRRPSAEPTRRASSWSISGVVQRVSSVRAGMTVPSARRMPAALLPRRTRGRGRSRGTCRNSCVPATSPADSLAVLYDTTQVPATRPSELVERVGGDRLPANTHSPPDVSSDGHLGAAYEERTSGEAGWWTGSTP